jgi:RNA polymerase sigma-B factor
MSGQASGSGSTCSDAELLRSSCNSGSAEDGARVVPVVQDPREQLRRERIVERNELERLCIEYARSRDPELRVKLVEAHQWLVVLSARQMQRRQEPLEDLIQVANVGLLQALDRFDPTFGVTFRTFASATLAGVLRHHYRNTWRLRIPRRVQELQVHVSRAMESLSGELQRSPTIAEVAVVVGASAEDVIEAIDAGANFWPLSLSHHDQTGTHGPIEVVHDHDDVEEVERKLDVRALLAKLPDRERQILYMSYFEDKTQLEIGEALGLSQVHVSRIMRAALLQLRNRL